MRKMITTVIGVGMSVSAFAATPSIVGAGSSFVYPIMSQWGAAYNNKTGAQVNYQAIGSGGGLSQLKKHTIQFAGVDMPQSVSTLNHYHWLQFPIVSGGIVLAINLPGVHRNELVLNGTTTAQIFMGKIKTWNDPRIAKLNPKVKLPKTAITVIHRADGSGTTYNFADYLATVSPTWKKSYGVNTEISWPTGLGAKGNAGVATYVQHTPGSIGYVGYSYAASTGLDWAAMKNASGKVVTPSMATFTAAAKNANWRKAPGFKLLLVNQPGANSWPITASTFILLPKKQNNTAIFKFFNWCFASGTSYTKPLNYVAIPKSVARLIQRSWKHA